MLRGAHAQSKKHLIDTTKHLVMEAPHPSPLSAYRGFFGCRHFSRCNTYLSNHQLQIIDRSIPALFSN
jgi:uracil-DNA glycosylase